MGLKSDRKEDLEAGFFSSCAGGGGSGFAAASSVPALEGSAFFHQNGREGKTAHHELFANERHGRHEADSAVTCK